VRFGQNAAIENPAAIPVPRRPSDLRKLIGGGAVFLTVRGIGLLATIGLQIVLARELGASSFGLYSFGFALLLLLVIPGKWGLDLSTFRFASERFGLDDPAGAHQYARYAMARVVLVSTVIAVVWAAVSFASGNGDMGDVVLLAACLPFLALIRVTEAALRASNRLVAAYAPFTCWWPVLFLAIVATLASQVSIDLRTVLVIQLTLFVAVATWQTRVVLSSHGGAAGRPLSEAERRTWTATSLNLAFISAFAVILGQSDIVLCKMMLGDVDAGIYAAAWRIASVVGAFLLAFNYCLGPIAARMYWRGKRDELQALLTRTTSVVLLLCGVVAVGVLALGPLVLGLFGTEFEVGYAALVLLVAAHLANAVWGPVNLLLTVTGHERDAAVVLAIAATANVALNIALISVMGIEGAALGTCVCTIAWNRAMAGVVSSRLGLRVFDPMGALRLLHTRGGRAPAQM
jgi:O-antigen/teichoic acid export membrane protein